VDLFLGMKKQKIDNMPD